MRRIREHIALLIAPWLLQPRVECPGADGLECRSALCIVYGCEADRRGNAEALMGRAR